MRITQKQIAQRAGISDGHLSQVLSGDAEVGKKAAKAFGSFCGRPWTDFLTMAPMEIRKVLFDAAAANFCGESSAS